MFPRTMIGIAMKRPTKPKAKALKYCKSTQERQLQKRHTSLARLVGTVNIVIRKAKLEAQLLVITTTFLPPITKLII